MAGSRISNLGRGFLKRVCGEEKSVYTQSADMVLWNEKLPNILQAYTPDNICFKHVKSLPVEYYSNKKAWMTSEIFTEWVKKLEKKMLREKRKIALIVDNCPAHPKIAGLKAVELVFLPPNTTSKTQPMNQGIIQNLKVNYRKRVLLKFIKSIDRDEAPNINVLDALHLLSQAWNCVTSSTVFNCCMDSIQTSFKPSQLLTMILRPVPN